ncbi:type VII secretion integral membrane protein EccD [Solwaraspora sp. WMMD406]|uniref:type VII secretion integral membrane protein EccD n=1 Tax=Solwaraspora sp. WMMD406 TaxID=3016095 RepID=UPI002416627E|nr:type VII secretion integral membrane protein EccD [Solwaraspora sp. WMMD406]MDG4765073.1 type VII secretion integral membrane protein EccD [Solwaraspora sp. WMMD406]
MATTEAAPLCRLTVHGPRRSADLALPTHIALVELQTELVRLVIDPHTLAGADSDGWVLQRLGEEPLDTAQTAAVLGLRDGDALHVRPRSTPLPVAAFDDVIDGVATGIAARPNQWRTDSSELALRAALVAALSTGLALLALPGATGVGVLVAAGAAVALLAAAATVARAFADQTTAMVLGCAAIGYAVLAGLLLPGQPLAAPALLSAAAAAGGFALLLRLLIGAGEAVAVAVLTVALFGVAAGVGATMVGLSTAATAALTLCVVAVAIGLMPMRAVRLAGITLPPLPKGLPDLQRESDLTPGDELIAAAARVDRYLTALYTALAVVAAVTLTVLAWSPGWAATAMTVAGILLTLLEARSVNRVGQRFAFLCAGGWGLAQLLLANGFADGPGGRAVTVLVLVVAAVAVAFGVRALPQRQFTAYWGRAGDILQTAAALSLLPLAMDVLGVYRAVRGIGG